MNHSMNDKQKQAFEIYYTMGRDRSLAKLSQLIDMPVGSLNNWNNNFRWAEQVIKRDAETLKRSRLKLETEVFLAKEELLALIESLIKKFKNAVEESSIEANTIGDLEKLTKLWLLLSGEPTENTERKVIFEDVESPMLETRNEVDDAEIQKLPGEY